MKLLPAAAATALCLIYYASMLLLPDCAGGVYDFFLLPNITNATDGQRQCRERGYDGLAALSTPEAYLQALELSADVRAVGLGIDVGLYYFHDKRLMVWSDGNVASPDLPWKSDQPVLKSSRVVGRIFHGGTMMLHSGKTKKICLCGHYDKSEASFSIFLASEPETFENWTLGESVAPSYISCSIRCGLEDKCRGAVFMTDVLTCRLFNTNLPLDISFNHNPLAMTFVRTRYHV